MQPRLLLLDEPRASLDTARKREILPYLERLRDDTQMPMIYVSHNATDVKLIASRVVWLDGGRVTTTGGVERLDATQADMLA
jgi:molybdate transport system ATP-binding protein